ncbi:MAG TPA: hypothetical protein VNL77_23595, partial [Roseiflexaceae bacterium]|nr:hypothetical protein [Roseiflexaceae bacterium]
MDVRSTSLVERAASPTTTFGATAHLAALLDWLRRLLSWQIALTRETFGPLADDTYRGLYVPRAEVEILGAAPQPLPPELARLRAALAQER